MMKHSKLMEERIRRTRILFKELGYKIFNAEAGEDVYTAGFEKEDGLQGGFFIDRESKFLEVTYTFSFPPSLSDFLKERLEDMLKVCYEFGCYTNIQKGEKDFNFSVFSKIYFAGLNYYSLRDSLRDFSECIAMLTDLLAISKNDDKEEG